MYSIRNKSYFLSLFTEGGTLMTTTTALGKLNRESDDMERKWHVELNEARESDLPGRLEPIGFCRGIVAEKVRGSCIWIGSFVALPSCRVKKGKRGASMKGVIS